MLKFNKISSIILSLLVASLGCADNVSNIKNNTQTVPSNYEECVQAGYPTTRSMPPQCIANGVIFRPEANTVKKEIILKDICKNECGNGMCEEIVCMGSGCPCSESPASCPVDCK